MLDALSILLSSIFTSLHFGLQRTGNKLLPWAFVWPLDWLFAAGCCTARRLKWNTGNLLDSLWSNVTRWRRRRRMWGKKFYKDLHSSQFIASLKAIVHSVGKFVPRCGWVGAIAFLDARRSFIDTIEFLRWAYSSFNFPLSGNLFIPHQCPRNSQ